MKNIRIALALALAVSVGLAAGILVAPEKGGRTRRKLREAASDLLEDLEQSCQDTIEDLKDKAEKKYYELVHRLECGSTCQNDDTLKESVTTEVPHSQF